MMITYKRPVQIRENAKILEDLMMTEWLTYARTHRASDDRNLPHLTFAPALERIRVLDEYIEESLGALLSHLQAAAHLGHTSAQPRRMKYPIFLPNSVLSELPGTAQKVWGVED